MFIVYFKKIIFILQISGLFFYMNFSLLVFGKIETNARINISSKNEIIREADTRKIKDIFPEPFLADIIRVKLKKSSVEDEVTTEELKTIITLDAAYSYPPEFKKIKNLKGIEELTELEELRVSSHEIEDITLLGGLSKLRKLNIYINKIVDLSPLKTLDKLTYLSATLNQIESVSPLKDMIQLEILKLSKNKIENIEDLKKLENITELWLHKNKIKDITTLQNLSKLKKLRLEKNQISNLGSLQNLSQLEEVSASDQEIYLSDCIDFKKGTSIQVRGKNDEIPMFYFGETEDEVISNKGIYSNDLLRWFEEGENKVFFKDKETEKYNFSGVIYQACYKQSEPTNNNDKQDKLILPNAGQETFMQLILPNIILSILFIITRYVL